MIRFEIRFSFTFLRRSRQLAFHYSRFAFNSRSQSFCNGKRNFSSAWNIDAQQCLLSSATSSRKDFEMERHRIIFSLYNNPRQQFHCAALLCGPEVSPRKSPNSNIPIPPNVQFPDSSGKNSSQAKPESKDAKKSGVSNDVGNL